MGVAAVEETIAVVSEAPEPLPAVRDTLAIFGGGWSGG